MPQILKKHRSRCTAVIVSSSRLLLLPQFYKLAHLEPLKQLKTGFSGRNEKEKKKKRERDKKHKPAEDIISAFRGPRPKRPFRRNGSAAWKKMAGNTKDKSITFVLAGMEEYLSELHLHNLAHLSHFLLVK